MNEQLVELIKRASGGKVEITPDTNLAMELVTDVEDTFNIEVSDEAVESIHTAGELDAYIKEMIK